MKKEIMKIPFFIFSLILLVFFYLLLIERNPSELPSALIDNKIPQFSGKILLKDEIFNSNEKIKNKITLINFFATWCKPCLKEHEYIMRFGNKKNINLIGINYKDNPAKTKAWLEKLGNPYSSVVLDKNGKIGIDFGVYGIPETFLINSSGIIKYRHVGPITDKEYDKIILMLKKVD